MTAVERPSMPSEPALEMLWEAADPRDALMTRFGFPAGAAAGRWVATALAERWGVRVDSCERIVMSGHNALAWVGTPGARLIAKWSVVPERFPRLAGLARLLVWLEGRGLPVSAPVATPEGHHQVELDGASVGVQREVAGDLLDTTDEREVRAAGAVLARLHAALAVYPEADRIPGVAGRSAGLTDELTGWLDAVPDHVPAAARDALRRLVAEAPGEPLPVQLVHGDFRSANVLCVGPAVAAVLDFEEARLDHRVVELARSAVLLGTRFRDWGPVSAEVRTWFLDGYASVSPLTPTEAAWWDALVAWHSVAMMPRDGDPTGWGPAALAQLSEPWSQLSS
ncbi:phosphotransferase [Friedmanniella luteola]|uniref:phosphotransferase n=1 Tax=Friedmanniella luteola TaxID=546871 RepID=UPI001E345318|nr:phosphotransferase [Friedmanniella luteola]